ncbi:hypothetical protein B0H14DRAFT_3128926 [Mycena olivaceomarginata]|nr:hypothetical protein B0H14DRAFT_3128926 [Mycena olivaceomarginata]
MSHSTTTNSDSSGTEGRFLRLSSLVNAHYTEGLLEYAKYLTASERYAKQQEEQQIRKAEDVRKTLDNIYEEVGLHSVCSQILVALTARTARGCYEVWVEPGILETGNGMDFIRMVFNMDSSEFEARLDAWEHGPIRMANIQASEHIFAHEMSKAYAITSTPVPDFMLQNLPT